MVRPNLARTLLSYILSVAIIAVPNFALARSTDDTPVFVPEFAGQQYDGIKRFQFQTSDDAALEQELNRAYAQTGGGPLEKIANRNDLVQTIRFYHAAYIQAREKMRAEYKELGPDKFAEELDKDKIAYDIPGAGKVEFSAVDGYPTGRITDPHSGVKIVFVEPEVERDSNAEKLLVARMWYDSGTKRKSYEFKTPDGQSHDVPLGRDVILVSVSDNQVVNNGIRLRAKPRTRREKIEGWWRATYQAPTWYTTWVGALSAGAQYGSAKLTAAAFVWSSAHLLGLHIGTAHPPSSVAYLSLGMAFGMGWLTRFYQNWRKRGRNIKELERKDMVTNVAMYLGIKEISPGGIVQMFNIFTPASTAFNILQFWISLQISKRLKQPFNKFSDVKARLRQDRGWATIPVPMITRDETGRYYVSSVKMKTPLKKVDWYRQFKYYLPRNAMSQGDRMWFTWMLKQYRDGFANWYTPWLSTACLAMMIPVMWKVTKVWARVKYPNTEEQERIDAAANPYLSPREAAVSLTENIPFVGQRWSERLDQFLKNLNLKDSIIGALSGPTATPVPVRADCEDLLKRRPPYDDIQ